MAKGIRDQLSPVAAPRRLSRSESDHADRRHLDDERGDHASRDSGRSRSLQAGPIHPYTRIVFFLILPGVFALGLVLMPIGGLWRRIQLRRQGVLPHVYPTIDLRKPVLQRALLWVFALTFANVAIMGTASYKAVEHMDSVQFCGQTCHSVMAPEYTAYSNSPALARGLCGLPHRRRSSVVRSREDLRCAAALRREPEDLLSADPVSGAQPASGAGHVRALPLAGEIHGRQVLGQDQVR